MEASDLKVGTTYRRKFRYTPDEVFVLSGIDELGDPFVTPIGGMRGYSVNKDGFAQFSMGIFLEAGELVEEL